jgi:KDO2-lipid IV(A) lauroyltransferase
MCLLRLGVLRGRADCSIGHAIRRALGFSCTVPYNRRTPAMHAAASTHAERTPLSRFVAPRYWRVWIILAVMRLVYMLPLGVQRALGVRSGRAAMRALHERREIASRNIALCFPAMDKARRDELLQSHFESLGIAVCETAVVWWAPDERLRELAVPEGLEHLHAALERGRGALLFSAHFTCLEMGARLLCMYTPLHVMYRQHENPLWEEILRRGRDAHAEKVIRRQDVRQLIRSLRDNKAVWFAPDQAPRPGKDTALVPFFGEAAVTNTSTSRIAQITGAAVLPYFPERLADGRYRMIIGAALENFPSADHAADAARLNALIEARVREVPEQYLWIHRRFKRRPPDYPDAYEGIP